MTTENLATSSPPSRPAEPIAVAVLLVITCVALGRICVHDFCLWDDQMTIAENAWLKPPTIAAFIHYWAHPEGGLYIPLTYTAWLLIASVAQISANDNAIALNPWLFHSASVAVHLIAVVIAYRIIRLLGFAPMAAFCGAAVFAIHPLQVEAVAWTSGFKDVLAGTLALLAISHYVRFAQPGSSGNRAISHYVLAVIAFVLALLSKPGVMALPLALLAIDRWIIKRDWPAVLRSIAPLILAAAPFAVMARLFQDASRTPMPPIWIRPLIACDALAFYLGKLIWPLWLGFDYGRSPSMVVQHGWCWWDWIFPVAVAILLVTARRRSLILCAGAVIFLAGCLPVLGFTAASFEFFSTTADHYLYVSMFGVALAAAWCFSRFALPMRAVALVLIATLAALSYRQAGFWSDDITFFLHDTQVNPGSFVAWSDLGQVYERLHDLPDAADSFRRALACNPHDSLSQGSLADVLNQAGQTDQAVVAARKAVEMQTEHPELRYNWPQDNALLGELLYDKGDYHDALPYLQTAAPLEPLDRLLQHDLTDARSRITHQPAAADH
jgi:tetratricopeptide (TPR) repeat protein